MRVTDHVLGVDLSSVVHTLFPTGTGSSAVSLCKDPKQLVRLASMSVSDPEFRTVFESAFDTACFRMMFGMFCCQLREQRPHLLFVVDGPPPLPKQENAKHARNSRFSAAIQTLATDLLDQQLGNDRFTVEVRIKKNCALAVHRWTRQFIEIALDFLKERNIPFERAQCEAEQVLVRRQRDGVVHDILCNDADYLVIGTRALLFFTC